MASDRDMTVHSLVESYIDEHPEYDGLLQTDGVCACLVSDLAPCGEMSASCRLGHRVELPSRDEDCIDCEDGPHWHINAGPRPLPAPATQAAAGQGTETRWFPLQLDRHRDYVLPQHRHIPWAVAEKAYVAYAERCGRDQSLERLAERGGFGQREMDMFLPDWRDLLVPAHPAEAERHAFECNLLHRDGESIRPECSDPEWHSRTFPCTRPGCGQRRDAAVHGGGR